MLERFLFTDVFNLILYEFYTIPFTELLSFSEMFILRSFPAFLMDLSIHDAIGVNKFTPLLDSISFSESVREIIERLKAVGGTIISQISIKNLFNVFSLACRGH